MSVDRWPTDFFYASRRLLTAIAEQDAAARNTSWNLSSVKFAKAGLEVGAERAAADDNIFKLIRRGTELVRDSTGTIDDPAPSAYLRLTTHLHRRRLPLWQGWERANSHEISAFIASERYPGVGRVLLALVGSTRNFMDAQGRDQSTALRMPSDHFGLYDIIAHSMEADEGNVTAEILKREQSRYSDKYPNARYVDVVNLLFGPVGSTQPMERVEILLKVHHARRNVDVDTWDSRYSIDRDGYYQHGGVRATERYALAVIGAPVWIAKSPEDDLELLPNGLQRYQASSLPGLGRWVPPLIEPESSLGAQQREESWKAGPPRPPMMESQPELVYPSPSPYLPVSRWAMIQEEMEAIVSTTHHGRKVSPSHHLARHAADHELVFNDLVAWFAYQALRFGPTPVPLSARLQPRWWRRSSALGPVGAYGWMVPARDNEVAMVTAHGQCYHVNSMGESRARYGVTQLPQSLRSSVAANILEIVAHWWRDPG